MKEKINIKTQHTYREPVKLGVYYTYDKKHNRVYDIKELKLEFKELVKKLKYGKNT